MDDNVAQHLAYILAESLDDAKFVDLVRDDLNTLAPQRVPIHQINEHVEHVVRVALERFTADPSIHDLLHDAMMNALEDWYEPHER